MIEVGGKRNKVTEIHLLMCFVNAARSPNVNLPNPPLLYGAVLCWTTAASSWTPKFPSMMTQGRCVRHMWL